MAPAVSRVGSQASPTAVPPSLSLSYMLDLFLPFYRVAGPSLGKHFSHLIL